MMTTIAARTTASTRMAKAPKASRGAKTTTVMRRAALRETINKTLNKIL